MLWNSFDYFSSVSKMYAHDPNPKTFLLENLSEGNNLLRALMVLSCNYFNEITYISSA